MEYEEIIIALHHESDCLELDIEKGDMELPHKIEDHLKTIEMYNEKLKVAIKNISVDM